MGDKAADAGDVTDDVGISDGKASFNSQTGLKGAVLALPASITPCGSEAHLSSCAGFPCRTFRCLRFFLNVEDKCMSCTLGLLNEFIPLIKTNYTIT